MMTLKEAISKRHSVRRYLDVPIEEEKVQRLNEIIDV
ncbi:MAG: nitroreductase, partial [Clostridia bacterium]|nr:nitroreductase [Clostridia bacterium]